MNTDTATDQPRIIDGGRDETDPCQAGTFGCCIDHGADTGSCEGW